MGYALKVENHKNSSSSSTSTGVDKILKVGSQKAIANNAVAIAISNIKSVIGDLADSMLTIENISEKVKQLVVENISKLSPYDDTEIKAEIELLKEDVNSLNTSVETINSVIGNLSGSDNSEIKQNIKQLSDDMEVISASVERLNETVEKLTNYDDTEIKENIEQLSGDVGKLKTAVENLEKGGTGGGGSYDDTEIKTEIANIWDTINYVEPKVNSFNMNPSTTQYEIGSTVNSVSFSWALNKDVVEQTLTGCSIAATDRSATYATPFSSNKTFTLRVTDSKGKLASASKTISFLNKKYYGVGAAGVEITSEFIRGLTGSFASNRNGNFNVNAGEGMHIYFAVPSSFGTPTFSVGGFSGGFDKAATISFTNASGYTCNYDVYKSSNANLGATTVAVS